MDNYSMIKKCLIIGIILMFVGVSITSSTTEDRKKQTNLVRNVSISSNGGNDYHPRMTTNDLGHTIVVYEQELDSYSKNIAVVYSDDDGQTWTEKLSFDSDNFTDGSGVLEYPNIVYNKKNDVLYLSMIDPNAEMYNNEMCFIPGDIASCVSEVVKQKWYGTSACGDDYLENAATTTENFFLSMIIRNGTLDRYLDCFYFTYPNYEFPPGIGGVYPDYESVHKTSPASNIEMDTGNRIYLVAESGVKKGPKITVKSATADEELLTSGEQQNGMDKYPDIEQWPGEYIANGTDPDVSAFSNKVYIVYCQDNMVKCSFSTAEDGYEPRFNWYTSTVDRNASTPAVYTFDNNVYCAYVKNGNLYLKVSENGGLTWGAAEKKNAVDGTVVAENGAVDICRGGIAFTDTRNGNYDIYYAPFVAIVIDSISGGFGVTAVFKNIGGAAIENFPWSITLTGTIFIGVGEEHGTVSLPPGASMTIHSFMVGFGAVTVTVTADTTTKTKDFKLFLIYFKDV